MMTDPQFESPSVEYRRLVFGLPCWARDQIRSRTDITLSLRDRLRVLVRGKLTLHLRTNVENPPGRTEIALSETYVHPIRRPRHTVAQATAEPRP